MDDIAAAVGLTKAGLYHHIRSKEDLLFGIMSYGMDLFEEKVLSRVREIRDPIERLRAAVRGHVRLVARDRPKEVTVILHEPGALKGRARTRINARKKAYIRFLEGTIRELTAAGVARPIDPAVGAFAILGMVNWIYQWYRPGGRLSETVLADAFVDFALNGLMKRGAKR